MSVPSKPQLLHFKPLAEQIAFWKLVLGELKFGYLTERDLAASTSSVLVPRLDRVAGSANLSYSQLLEKLWQHLLELKMNLPMSETLTTGLVVPAAGTNEFRPRTGDQNLDVLVIQVRRRYLAQWNQENYVGWKLLSVSEALCAMLMNDSCIPPQGFWLVCGGSSVQQDHKITSYPAFMKNDSGLLVLTQVPRVMITHSRNIVLYAKRV